MNMRIEFDTGNAAFADGNGPEEAARILDTVAQRLRDGHDCGVLYDNNGNEVGVWNVDFPTDDED